MPSKKTTLRDEMRRVLAALDERWVAAASREACGNISRLLDAEAKGTFRHILAWTSFFPGEPDLASFILRYIDDYAFFLPRAAPDRSMAFLEIDKDWTLDNTTDDLGIPAPENNTGTFYNPEHGADTMVLIPGLAFDAKGNRLGRGKGYYDRFLADPRMQLALKVGVAWNFQVVSEVPVSAHDIPMDWIVTEEGIIKVESSKIISTKSENK